MERVGVAELKDNLSRYLRAAEGGAEVEVTDRDRPIARIVPIATTTNARVVIRRAKKPLADVRGRVYPPGGWSKSSLDVLLEERQGR
ncbi:MAG: type II toxin-antitoxin system Phd/YefM family antitoxin [Candidatus Limnocylindrales bacterium]